MKYKISAGSERSISMLCLQADSTDPSQSLSAETLRRTTLLAAGVLLDKHNKKIKSTNLHAFQFQSSVLADVTTWEHSGTFENL